MSLSIHNYKILEKINNGAFGEIYLGRNKRTQELVVIKTEIHHQSTIQHETKMLQYLATAKVNSIPLVYLYCVSSFVDYTQPPRPLLILPYYKQSLTHYLKQHPKKTVIDKIMHSMLKIFEQIHKQYVVHRDIKPQNFMMNDKDEVVLIDFGLSTFFVDENANLFPNEASQSMIGTPKFTSIYVHLGNKYTVRDDMISLGYLYVWMLHGGYCPWDPMSNTSGNIHPSTYEKIHIHHEYNKALLQNKDLSQYIRMCQLKKEDAIVQYLQHVYFLEYEERPDHVYLQPLFCM